MFRALLEIDARIIRFMANHTATKKSIRTVAKRSVVNSDRRNAVRRYIKKVENLIEAGDKKEAQTAFRAAQQQLMKAVSKGVFKLNTASRKLSRLSKRIKSLA